MAAAEAFRLNDALYLIQARAQAMAECAATSNGTMLAVVGLSREALEAVAREAGVVMANFNTPDQLVLSGRLAGIEQAEGLAKANGAKRAIKLDVAGAFHSPLMQAAADAFKRAIEKVVISPPKFSVISNVTGLPVTDPEHIRALLVKQITSSVLWEPSMRWLVRHGATTFIEFPPARVLTGLLRKIDPSVKGLPIDEPADFDKLSSVLSPHAS